MKYQGGYLITMKSFRGVAVRTAGRYRSHGRNAGATASGCIRPIGGSGRIGRTPMDSMQRASNRRISPDCAAAGISVSQGPTALAGLSMLHKQEHSGRERLLVFHLMQRANPCLNQSATETSIETPVSGACARNSPVLSPSRLESGQMKTPRNWSLKRAG